jgi:adenine-specific DNA-methyltransferase
MITNRQMQEPGITAEFLKKIEAFRGLATKALDPVLRRERGQFLTPQPVAEFMATLFQKPKTHIHLLDAGAGTGILSAAVVHQQLILKHPPKSISVTAFEIDPLLRKYLKDTYRLCAEQCNERGVAFSADVHSEDFIAYAASVARGDMFAPMKGQFNAAIVNPPYSKINSDSETRRLLRSAGIETSNLYTAFLALLSQLLDDGGELVAITPRSFCNGPYFKPFRVEFLNTMSVRRIHVFESRSKTFKDDEVLQENIITYGVKTKTRFSRVILSTSDGTPRETVHKRSCAYEDVVSSKDPERVIHLTTDELQADYRRKIGKFTAHLSDLGLNVSTGRVVDFRAREFLRDKPEANTVPLVYPCHFNGGFVTWPKLSGRKPNAIVKTDATDDLLVPAGVYVLVKRFTTKEEPRRVVACIYDPSRITADFVGFENHLDYFHMHGEGLQMDLAKGLAAFLNSTLLDAYFRQFNGHTQVNAADLRRLSYPSREALERLGRIIGETFPDQATIDDMIQKELF